MNENREGDDMPPRERPAMLPLGRLEWGVIFSILLSCTTTIFTAGVLYADVRNQERRLIAMEAKYEGVGEKLGRIEEKLAFLVARYQQDVNGVP